MTIPETFGRMYLDKAEEMMKQDSIECETRRIVCAVCGQPCIFVSAIFGGWYCAPCDAFTETDVEVED
jgi:hypothetical protein